MNIYTYTKVTDFLTKYNANLIYHNTREYYFRTNHQNIYTNIIDLTAFLNKPSFIERLYCYTNNITKRPKCAICDNEVTFNRNREYNKYCSHRCSMVDMKTLIGANASQLQSVKDKKKSKSLEKYGVDNPSKSAEIKNLLSDRRTAYWDNIYKHKKFTTDGLSRTQYKHRATQYARTQYTRYKNILDPFSL